MRFGSNLLSHVRRSRPAPVRDSALWQLKETRTHRWRVSLAFARIGAWTVLSSPSPKHPSCNCGSRADESRSCGNRANDRADAKEEEAASDILNVTDRFFFDGLHGDLPFWVYRSSELFSLVDSGFGWNTAAEERANCPAILTPSESVSTEKRQRSLPRDSIFPVRE